LLLYIKRITTTRSVRLDDDIILDFDENDAPVALGLLNASRHLQVSKSSLIQPIGLDINIGIGERIIKLEAHFSVSVHQNDIPRSLNSQIANKTNLFSNEVHFATA
jgi:uncharacterized protein YuzE